MADDGDEDWFSTLGGLIDDPTTALTYVTCILAVVISIPILHRVPRSRGTKLIFHLAFVVSSALVLYFVPESIQSIVFSQGGVLVIGTLLPVYESIVAVCTIGETDDTTWLQYWLTSGSFSYATEFMDTIADKVPFIAEHWYELEFLVVLWLLLPFTDGAALFYDKITGPYISPITKSLKEKMEGWMGFITAAINSGYIWGLWFTFMSLPEEARRFVVIAVGTVYPLVASTVAITTESNMKDDTYWLTYWSCFSVLFILMDYLENFVGHIRGFYSICLCATVYLFLPMFQGADAVFRNVLVPLSGQYENMLLRDAYFTRLEMEKKIPEKKRESVFSKAAEVFIKGKKQA